MAKRKIDALSFKTGPTQSGLFSTPHPVGGELVGIDVVSVFLSRYWPLLLLLLIPFALALYSKRNAIPNWLLRLTYWLKGL